MSLANDLNPGVHRSRSPKTYTEEQLEYLRSHLAEFERRSNGTTIRGDAKKFALERASDFIARFGLPLDSHGDEESDARFREQIYNWFKNTLGRTRRKLEGRPRSVKKAAEKAGSGSLSPSDIVHPNWNTNVLSPTIIPYQQNEIHHANADIHTPVHTSPIRYGGLHSPSMSSAVSSPDPVSVTIPSSHSLSLNLNFHTLREAFLTQAIDPSTLSSMIQTYAMSNPSLTPLTTVVHALFDAISMAESPQLSPQSPSHSNFHSDGRDANSFLRRYLDASTYFPSTVVHAGVSGPLAGPRALQMQIRQYSTWVPNATPLSHQYHNPTPSSSQVSSSSISISDEMQRIATDRQRRKDYIQWAKIHAAALELGMMGMGHAGETDNSGYAYAMGRSFSEMMARDLVWQPDEAEWVAGICVLRAVIRTALRGDQRQREEYTALLKTYEGRWKEIKDEARQSLVEQVLLGAKDDLSRLD